MGALDSLAARPASRTPTRTATPVPHGVPQSAHPPGRKRLPRKGFRTSSPELQAASFAYDWPDEMPADGELTATPGRRPELLIWADNAHTRWQLTASLPTVVGGWASFWAVARASAGWRARWRGDQQEIGWTLRRPEDALPPWRRRSFRTGCSLIAARSTPPRHAASCGFAR